jgi:hypothetical protein
MASAIDSRTVPPWSPNGVQTRRGCVRGNHGRHVGSMQGRLYLLALESDGIHGSHLDDFVVVSRMRRQHSIPYTCSPHGLPIPMAPRPPIRGYFCRNRGRYVLGPLTRYRLSIIICASGKDCSTNIFSSNLQRCRSARSSTKILAKLPKSGFCKYSFLPPTLHAPIPAKIP